jgi:hypothetical protein
MGTTTTNMGLSKPTLAGDAATWDDQINASLDAIDLHNHTTGAGVQIPAGGLNLTTDLTLNGTCALTNAKALAFTTQASYTVSKSLWVKTSDGELYWRNASGTDVKITSGGTLNISIVGGILGDYAAAAAAVYYDDSAQAYRFLEAAPSPNSWSRVQCGDLDLYEHASGIANRVRLASPTGLAASYALTLPAALPGSTSILQVSSAGAITASNTVGSLTVSSGGHVTVSGSGEYKHGSRTLNVPICGAMIDANWTKSIANGYLSSTAAAEAALGIPLLVGDRLTSVTFTCTGNSSADVTATVYLKPAASVTVSNLGSGTATNPSLGLVDTVINVTDTTLVAGDTIFVYFSANASSLNLHAVQAVYDHP